MKKQVVNPYLPSWEYVPDGEPHVFGDRVYLYGSHDRFNGEFYCELDYVCWSAPIEDLSDWRYEGVIYSKKQDPSYGEDGLCMWAPDVCIGPDGQYYMYYCGAFSCWIGVARSPRPEGPYAYYGRVKHSDGTIYGNKCGDMPFDPGVLADSDGKIWLYSGFAKPEKDFQEMIRSRFGLNITGEGSVVMELERDMLTIKSHKLCLPGVINSKGTGFEGHEFYEASSVRKFGGKYYYIYSSILSHELAYAVSDHPDRGFVYQGPLHSNANIGFNGQPEATAYWGNNHGSVEYIHGDYYIFGHRQTNGTEFSRQGVAEKIVMNSDGTFQMAEMTSCGLNDGPLAANGRYEAGIACVLMGKNGAEKSTLWFDGRKCHPYITQDGGDRNNDPGQYIANFGDGCLCGYKYFRIDTPKTDILVSYRAHAGKTGAGKLIVGTGLGFFQMVSYCDVDVDDDIRSAQMDLKLAPGTYPLYIKYEGTGSLDLMYITFDERKGE